MYKHVLVVSELGVWKQMDHPQLLGIGSQTGIQEACQRGVGEGQHKAALLRLSMERNMG